MSGVPQESRRLGLAECCGFVYLFRAFRLAIHPTALLLAFCCVFGTYLTGRILDRVWPESGRPVIISTAEQPNSELAVFTDPDGGGRIAAKAWLDKTKDRADAKHVGAFRLLLDHGRTAANSGSTAVMHLDAAGLLGAFKSGAMAVLWLVAFHPVYGVIFLVVSLLIWSYFGGALCRVIAMQAARDERIGFRQALAFSRGKFASFFAAPLMPVGALLFGGFLLWVGGMLLAIPWIGELLSAVILPLAIVGGLVLAFIMIGAWAGSGMMYPTIAAEGSDAFDAISRSFSYTYMRPWRLAWYGLLSTVYGVICLLFVKFFVRLALWLVHLFMGASMNWGSASGHTSTGTVAIPEKLNALWTGPSLVGDTAFWGGFPGHDLANFGWFAQIMFYLWIFTVYGLVVAFLASFCCSAWTLIYFLLRREVDATDLEDVYLEEQPEPAPASAPPTPGGSGDKPGDVSLPVIGPS